MNLYSQVGSTFYPDRVVTSMFHPDIVNGRVIPNTVFYFVFERVDEVLQ